MASAILLFYTSDGFLIAADGRMRILKVTECDKITKLFEIRQPGKFLAYAFGGSVALTDKEDSKSILFDFRIEATKIINSIRLRKHHDLSAYADELSQRLRRALIKARQNERCESFKKEDTLIACLVLAGFYKGQPSCLNVTFTHQEQTVLTPIIRTMSLAKGYSPILTYGSNVVRELIFETDDPRFDPYRVPRVNRPDDVTITEVADAARKYILACSDLEALRIDEAHCAGIGGHIHMANITKEDGFKWLPEFRPFTASTT
jgi:hypothetical protein